MSSHCATRTHHIDPFRDTSKAKDGEQVDVDGVAIEDVDAGKDVLMITALVWTTNITVGAVNWTLTIRPLVAQVYFSEGAAPSQPYFHLPSCFWH